MLAPARPGSSLQVHGAARRAIACTLVRWRRRNPCRSSRQSFEPPTHALSLPAFTLEPLGPRHNESDYAAWSSSFVHIRATPGFPWGSWPHEMSLAENLGDLEMHERHFETRVGFTYTVLDPESGEVIGCLYIYPVAR